jgi:hypothetical protein
MEFLYLCRPFPLEFLCTPAEIIGCEWAGVFAPLDTGQSSVCPSGICWHLPELRSEHSHDGRRDGGARVWLFRFIDRLCLRVRTALREIES